MDNLQFQRGKIKRSIESIIDESALDHQFNIEAQQLRRVYNANIKQLNYKIKEYERSIEQLKLSLRQKQQTVLELEDKNHKNVQQLEKTHEENMNLKRNNSMLKKRLQHIEYKLSNYQSNKNAVEITENLENDSSYQRTHAKKQAYAQINQIMSNKINKFTDQLKAYPMPIELQRNIEDFLEQILYINPHSLKHSIFNKSSRNRRIGQISDRKPHPTEKVSDHDQWQKLEKSVQKLKSISKSPIRKNQRLHRERTAKIMIHEPSPKQKNTIKLTYN